MYLIKLEHIGKDSTYTREEQSATSEEFKRFKFERMVDKWIEILCPYVDQLNLFQRIFRDELKPGFDIQSIYQLKVKYIQNYLNFINSHDGGNRKFSIEIIKRKPIELELNDDDDDDEWEEEFERRIKEEELENERKEEELEKKRKEYVREYGGYLPLSGDDNDYCTSDCEGWDGDARRCQCGSVKINWADDTLFYGHDV